MNPTVEEQIRIARATAVLEGKRMYHAVVATSIHIARGYVVETSSMRSGEDIAMWLSTDDIMYNTVMRLGIYYYTVHDPQKLLTDKQKDELRACGAVMIEP